MECPHCFSVGADPCPAGCPFHKKIKDTKARLMGGPYHQVRVNLPLGSDLPMAMGIYLEGQDSEPGFTCWYKHHRGTSYLFSRASRAAEKHDPIIL